MLPIAWLTLQMTIGELAVAVGTGLLAAFTCWLGFETKASAKAAQEAVEASEEPFVIATPTDNWQAMILRPHERPHQGEAPPLAIHRALVAGSEGSFVRLRLWNIGQGPAIVTAVQLLEQHSTNLLGDLDQHYAVRAGGIADIEIPSPAWASTLGDGRLTIDYVRASGLAYRTSQEVSIGDPTVQVRTYERSRIDEHHPSAHGVATIAATMGDKISQRNVFGRNTIVNRLSGVISLKNEGEREGFVKGMVSGVLVGVVVWLIVHFVFGG